MVNNKKEYLIIVIALIAVLGAAFLMSSHHQRLVTVYPSQVTNLSQQDFILNSRSADIFVGQSSWEDVHKIYPQGKTLGMSSVYHPQGLDAIFTFTKKSNVLSKADILGNSLKTSRNIGVNDTFDKVVHNYGPGYIRSYDKNNPSTFDAIYGSKHYIIFHVSNNTVKKIVIDYQTADSRK